MESICGATLSFDHDGPPMHVHPHTDEGFHIGEGEMTFLFVPCGVGHTVHITSALRGLLIYSSGDVKHVTEPV